MPHIIAISCHIIAISCILIILYHLGGMIWQWWGMAVGFCSISGWTRNGISASPRTWSSTKFELIASRKVTSNGRLQPPHLSISGKSGHRIVWAVLAQSPLPFLHGLIFHLPPWSLGAIDPVKFWSDWRMTGTSASTTKQHDGWRPHFNLPSNNQTWQCKTHSLRSKMFPFKHPFATGFHMIICFSYFYHVVPIKTSIFHDHFPSFPPVTRTEGSSNSRWSTPPRPGKMEFYGLTQLYNLKP